MGRRRANTLSNETLSQERPEVQEKVLESIKEVFDSGFNILEKLNMMFIIHLLQIILQN